MKKIVKLNESMIQNLVRKVLQEQKNERYMFFSNLEQMKRQCEMLLDLDESQIESILDNGHDWAQDHISEAKNNMDQVFDFLMNEINGGEEETMNIQPTVMESRKKTGTKLKDFKSALEHGPKDFPELVTLGEEVKQFARSFPTIGF
jgi:hypothetical protein